MTIDILKHGFTIKEVLVNMTHNETGRDLKGFIHRGKQFYHIKKLLIRKEKNGGSVIEFKDNIYNNATGWYVSYIRCYAIF
ncbi:group 2 glycosyltransferase domain protein [[Clostridium] sordellii ATCC 9714]|nr:group 2 glycosyltransferase domain protein [[Clostridium] sordellii ATCC 9714] [Paeniclostridium sordellii ATCC 9714]